MIKIIVFFLVFFFSSSCFSMEEVFYILHDKHTQALTRLSTYHNSHYILLAQAYRVNKKGEVAGEIDADVIQFTQTNSIKLMAMVTNSNFDPKAVTQFLANESAQKKSIETILNECKKNHLYGVQFDFEMIPLKDKDALTKYYQHAAEILQRNNFIVSFAVAPTIYDDNFPSYYSKKLYEVWQGAYDLKKLGAVANFVTIMAYDQHANGTIPGPIASTPWVDKVIQHALQFIPADKISLGIPTYSGYWYMGKSSDKIRMKYDAIDAELVSTIFQTMKPQLFWDNISQVHYTFYEKNEINRFIFLEDEKSFKAKLKLVKKYHLRGISVFRLGIEDPKIWKLLD